MKNLPRLFLPTLLLLSALRAATQLASAATETWTVGGADAKWSTPANWSGPNIPPMAGDSLSFGSSSQTTPNNDLTADTPFYGLTFTAAAAGLGYTLNGNNVLLSGQVYANTIGIVNNSGTAQAVGTMPLDLDWGYYTFSSPSGSLALNSTLTLNTGAVAYFGANNLTSPLAADGTTGLTPVLNGAGLIYSGSAPTGLATIDGNGNILAYTAYTSYAAAATLATTDNNIQLNTAAFPANTTYTANNLSINTISTTQVGNSGGTAVDVIAVNGTLTFADKGGFYALNAAAGAKNCLYVGSPGSGAITVGPVNVGGTLVLAVNGNNANNQVAVNSFIWNNGSGAVTVETVGSGSLNFNPSAAGNTYSGGTYVNQGQLQGSGAVTAFGTGPVYVAAGASVFPNVTGIWANDFYLSPGLGAPSGVRNDEGALLFGGNPTTLSGTIHLLGAPVTTGPGNRFSSNFNGTGNLIIAGQITGTGTLDFYQGPHTANIVLSNVTANANNWTGGLIVEPRSTLSCYLKLGANNQIPNGPGTGDLTLLSGGGDARFDLNGFSTTINALNAPNDANVAKHELGNYSNPKLPSTLTMGASGANGTFFGITSDAATGNTFTLIKIGSGTQTFNGAAAFAYHGNTTVSNGTFALAAAGQIPNSPVITVKSGATLDGSALTAGGLTIGAAQTLNCVGTVKGNTTINGTMQALDSIGTLANIGTVTLNGGGTYVWDINSATAVAGAGVDPGWSRLNITGGLTVAATSGSPFNINLTSLTLADVAGPVSDFDNTASYAWSIAKTTTGITGFDPAKFVLNTAGFANSLSAGQFFLTTNATDLILLFLNRPPVTSTVAGHGTFTGAPNLAYTVQYTDNLTPPASWHTLMTVTTSGTGLGSFIDASAPGGQPQRFYRVSYP